jgi:hypothetical protein
MAIFTNSAAQETQDSAPSNERGDVRESRAGNVRERLLSEERLVGRHEDVRECEQSRQHIVLQRLV